MRSALKHGTRGTESAVACDSLSTTTDYFYKGERRIQVGDCALFKSPQDSPHFVGLIRRLSSNEEENLSVFVNKLYRPIELKLGKGILLDAVPNEIFYSFQRHEIPAVSLLHPCKVAFLPEGVTLSSGISSFVCRRVFDTNNRCLQWLTDQEYIDERQQEVERLLFKTKIEMHATKQSSGRSSKPINSPKPTSQLKSGSDNVQTATSLPSQAKARKRDRTDQGFEPIKRGRSLKADDCDSAQYGSESILKFEISRITEKGGLVNSEGVEKLVQIMQPNRVEKKLELVSRSIFAGVIAATENFDCLSRFVQLKGLLLFDQWLQDVHKGKVGEGSPRDGDKSIEEFLFILLRALDKLPVNLQALQMCHIGKSVNHLRTFKNAEIQKKARSLVDTWKKRVEAEMNVIDTKCGSNQAVSWTSRSRLPECSHGGPSEAAMKSSTKSSAAKIDSIKPVQADMSAKHAILSPGLTKLAPSPGKDGEPRSVVGSNPDLPSNNARDERSSSSSHSHNSQSCSSDHDKVTGFSGKEDARSSTARSISVNKVSRGSSRPRRSVNGHLQTAPSASPQETGSSRNSSFKRNLALEKLSQSGLTCEKALDLPATDGSSHKLIVKIPNRGSSPAQCVDIGPVEDPTVMNSRVSSPVLSEKNDESDPNSMEKADVETTSDVKTESWQSNDFKDILTCSDEGDGSANGDDDAKLAEASEAVSHSLGNELKLEKLDDASYDSINALVESCVKYSQVNSSMSGGDDGGMNLLASVAAGEMFKSDIPSPDGSSGRTSNIRDESGVGDEIRSNAPDGNDVREQCRSEVGFHGTTKQENPISVIPEQAVEGKEHDSFKLESKIAVNLGSLINDLSYEVKDVAATSKNCVAAAMLMGYDNKQPDEKDETNIEATKLKNCSLSINDQTDGVSLCCEVKREASIGVPSNAFLNADSENKADVREASKDGSYTEQKPFIEVKTDTKEGCDGLNKDFLLRSACKSDGIKLERSEFEDRMACNEADESNEIESSATNSADETSHVNKKPKFDLNEGFSSEDGQLGEAMTSEDIGFPVSAHIVNPLPFSLASKPHGGLSTPITVAAAAKGAFVPPFDLLRSKRDGWKGTAATSAFRPTEPRKVLEMRPVIAIKQNRSVLDFDLNVADETSVDDVASIGLDLDLNRVEEAGDKWQGSSICGRGSEASLFPAKSRSLHGYPISESKEFDLNNGPVLDEAVEPSLHNKHGRSNIQSQHFFTGLRASAQETGTFSSWFPGGNALPPVALTPILSSRGDQPFPIVAANGPPRVFVPPTGPMPFSPELYRESMLSSSPPAVPFPSFQYPVFPFGTGFPLPSASLSTFTNSVSNGRLGFAPTNAQSLSGLSPPAVASHFSRPYFVSLPDGGTNTSVRNNRQWGREGLDLNAGPLTLETEGMDESSPLVSRQLSVASSRPLADEQGMMFLQAAGSFLKTKENIDNFRYK